MKVTIIYGSPRKGVTYEAIQVVKDEMLKRGAVEFVEFHLPQDAPVFCRGCFQCFDKGEGSCPDAKYIQPIVQAMESSDGLIIGSPVYVLQLSGALKAFFDHLGYTFLNHRPRFFRQKALIITATAGAGIKNANRYITENLSFWGINKTYSYGQPVLSASWAGIPPKQRAKLLSNLKSRAEAFYRDLASGQMHSPSLLQTLMFYAGKSLVSTFEGPDQDHWRKNDWLTKERRYYTDDVKPGLINGLMGLLVPLIFGRMIKK